MKKETLNRTILKYLRHLTCSEWILDEAYKFEFANFLQNNIDFKTQTDKEILEVLLKSQEIRYDNARGRGIQFIQISGRETLKKIIQLSDIALFREFMTKNFESIDWANRSMSYTALSAWLSTLFPNRLYPVPAMKFDKTIDYLFETDADIFPKIGKKYIIACQEFLKLTQEELKRYPLEEVHLKVWNKFFIGNPELNIKSKNQFDQVDWNWLAQDFHLFVYREVLHLNKKKIAKEKTITIPDNFEPIGIEGEGKLAIHMRYERDNLLIKKIKELKIQTNPMLNCEVCGFSFCEKYGILGQGFIEAHHKRPLSETKETRTTKRDIALVCSNCHRMLHKGISRSENNSIMTMEELKALIKD